MANLLIAPWLEETIGFGGVSGSFCFGGQKGECLFLRFLHLAEQTRHTLYLLSPNIILVRGLVTLLPQLACNILPTSYKYYFRTKYIRVSPPPACIKLLNRPSLQRPITLHLRLLQLLKQSSARPLPAQSTKPLTCWFFSMIPTGRNLIRDEGTAFVGLHNISKWRWIL